MNKTSIFNIKIDFDKSKGSILVDKNTKNKFIDFMGMYSSLAIGYNHSIFDESYTDEIFIGCRGCSST